MQGTKIQTGINSASRKLTEKRGEEQLDIGSNGSKEEDI